MNKLKDKFELTREQSIFLAKKKWDENIYCGMRMENRNVTFPQTQTILKGVNVGSVALDDVQAILNMRDAWRELVSSIDEQISIDYICKINGFVARNEALEWGVLRKGSVGVSGTSYSPPVPIESEVSQELRNIMLTEASMAEKAIDLFLWGVRRQMFWDGNKRTSLLAANKLLVSGGNGIMTIIDQHMLEFTTLLTEYFNTGEKKLIKRFLYENTISGINF